MVPPNRAAVPHRRSAGGEFPHLQAGNAQCGETAPRRGDGTADIDAAAAVLDHEDGKAFAPRVLGGVAHAKIQRQAGKKYAGKTALAQISDQASWRGAVVLVER